MPQQWDPDRSIVVHEPDIDDLAVVVVLVVVVVVTTTRMKKRKYVRHHEDDDDSKCPVVARHRGGCWSYWWKAAWTELVMVACVVGLDVLCPTHMHV